MRAAFIPALPPSALLAGMIAPSFRLVNRFCGKKLLRTCGRRERPPALCAVWARSPLAYVLLRTCGRHERPHALCAVWARSPLAMLKGSLPFDRSLWHRPSLRRTQATRALRAPERRKNRVSPHPAAVPAGPCSLSQSAEAPLHAPAPAAVGGVPAPTARAGVGAGLPPPRCARAFRVSKGAKGSVCPVGTWAEGPKRPEAGQRNHERDRQGSANDCAYREAEKRASPHPAAVLAGPCSLSQSAETPPHAPAPAAVGASPRPPLAPSVRASPAPASRKRFECPKDTRNAPRRTAPLATPGRPPAPAVGRFGGLTGPPNAFVSPGFAGRAGSLRPRKHSLRRPPPGEPAAKPPAK